MGLIRYCAKYVAKGEKKTASYKDIQGEVLQHVTQRASALSFVSKLMNKLIGERDWSAQEVSHLLLGLPLQECSRVAVILDCRPEKDMDDLMSIEEDSIKVKRSPYKRYKERLTNSLSGSHLQDVTLLEWLQDYNFITC